MSHSEFLNNIHDFMNNNLSLNWHAIWDDEEAASSFFEALDIVQQSLSLMPEVPHDKRIILIGKLALIRSQLDFSLTINNDEKSFDDLLNQLDSLLREIINLNFWLQQAQERLALFETCIENQDNHQNDATQFIFFQPVLLAVSLISLINFSPDEEMDHNEDSYCCDEDDEMIENS